MVNELVTVDTVVRDGSTVCLRQASEADVPRVMTFLESLSEDSLYQRFMGRPALTPARVRALTVPPALRAVALVAEVQGQIVGFAGFYPDGSDVTHAEVAFAVADALQGHGIGTRLLERLASIARDHGIDTFEADVLGDNRRMLDVFRECGYGVRSSIASGVCHVTLSLSPTETFQSKSAARSRTAATASMRPFFEPGHVAVIGASRERGKIGSEILHNLIASGFAGTVAAVHPTASTIDGVRAYPRVTDIPEPIDLAIVVVPAVNVLAAVEDCITKKVRAICVISAGFAESGEDGRILEAAIVNRIRDAGCRLIGPNCMGLLNTDPRVQLNATFSPVFPPSGRVAMSTQSGALGLAILDYAKQLNIGISSFVSVGNKPDVSSNDLIQYWAEDPRTSVILLYLESFGNPRKFAEIARRVGRHKPIVAVKAGRSSAGARAASSHTGALSTGDTVVEALFRHAGVIRTARLEEMFDVATLLANQPLPRGNRVAILTNAGGPGILAADACEAHGLRLPTLSEATRVALRSFLPPAASVANPVDMLASAPADHYRQALKALLEDDVVDSVITIFIPPLVTDSADVAAAIHEAAKDVTTKPILGVFMRAEGAPAALAPVPCYAFPESAALALARVATYGAWRERPVEAVPTLEEFDGVRVRTIVDRVLLRGGGWTTPDETTELLKATGLSVAPSRVAADLTEALASASVVGYPVVLKALGPTLLHKTERQAVVLNITTATELRAAYQGLALRLGGDMTSVLVQQMIPKGVEMIVGAVHDPLFGPMIACGTGGTLVDVIADTAFRLPPLTAFDAREMVNDLRGARLLRGYRGSPVADEQALQDVLLRVSALVDTAPEIQELDLNPVIVLSSGTVAADARVRIEPRRVARSGRRVEY